MKGIDLGLLEALSMPILYGTYEERTAVNIIEL